MSGGSGLRRDCLRRCDPVGANQVLRLLAGQNWHELADRQFLKPSFGLKLEHDTTGCHSSYVLTAS